MYHVINGIQQIGIGVANACEAFEWYKKKTLVFLLLFLKIRQQHL